MGGWYGFCGMKRGYLGKLVHSPRDACERFYELVWVFLQGKAKIWVVINKKTKEAKIWVLRFNGS